ncbi:MAG: type II toxin-antitoxin system VapC family toxin [Hyphomonadaceae bacterium]|nr:type II toxin-antitoxin system VapC family toxin [Hyphomonadaceae bacterium]
MILVDSNVIIDVMTHDATWGDWSATALSTAADNESLAINPIIYAELSAGFASVVALNDALGGDFAKLSLPYEAGFVAGKAFLEYRRRGGLRTSPLPDFYVGAHAAVAGFSLLTRDSKRYRSYFPALRLIAPN